MARPLCNEEVRAQELTPLQGMIASRPLLWAFLSTQYYYVFVRYVSKRQVRTSVG